MDFIDHFKCLDRLYLRALPRKAVECLNESHCNVLVFSLWECLWIILTDVSGIHYLLFICIAVILLLIVMASCLFSHL